MTIVEGAIYGVLGGAGAELYGFYNIRKEFVSNPPSWIKSIFYWIVTILMILFSGGIVCMYMQSGVNINYIMAVHIGAATPLILSTMLQSKPKIE
jgi:hypothetical protein